MKQTLTPILRTAFGRSLRAPVFGASLLCLAATTASSWAEEYSWIQTANNQTWTNTGSWTPTPPTGGPTAEDSIYISSTGTLLLGGDRQITNVTAEIAGTTIAGGNPQNSHFVFTISNNLTVNSEASLLLRNGSNASQTTLETIVQGNFTVQESGTLTLGGAGNDFVAAMAGFQVSGTTTLAAGATVIMYQGNGWGADVPLTLGDVVMANTSVINLSNGAQAGNFSRTVTARSLSGNGTIRVNSQDLSGSNTRAVTLRVETGATSNGDFSGVLENGGVGSTLSVVVAGNGVQTLSGNNTYTGLTRVESGTLLVNGSIAASSGVEVQAGGTLGGHGTVAAISGAGTVNPGNSAGILTAPSVDGSEGLDFVFQITQQTPAFSNAANSGNDILRLTGATPFMAALGAGNTVTVDFTGVSLTEGLYLGGFYVDVADFMEQIENANFVFLGASGFEVSVTTLQYSADFGAGLVNGYITGFNVTAIPEPGSIGFVLLGGLGVLAACRKRQPACRS